MSGKWVCQHPSCGSSEAQLEELRLRRLDGFEHDEDPTIRVCTVCRRLPLPRNGKNGSSFAPHAEPPLDASFLAGIKEELGSIEENEQNIQSLSQVFRFYAGNAKQLVQLLADFITKQCFPWELIHALHLLDDILLMDKNGVMKRLQKGLPSPPPILLLHDGPGLPSRYLEPLAARVCSNGRSCYMYDQLGCGLSSNLPSVHVDSVDDLQHMVDDLREVLMFLKHSLGEESVHVIAHGSGGALLMQTMMKDSWSEGELPKLRSICLLSVSSSTLLADRAATTLMNAAAESVGAADAARAFWYRHVCALKPQPRCLADAYQQSAGRRWGALRGFEWKLGSGGATGGWQLRGAGALDGWSLTTAELRRWATSGCQAPVLSLRGQHDFVTEECVAAWRALAQPDGTGFTEDVLGGCGHNAHLEAPDSVAATLRLWLLDAEDTRRRQAPRKVAPRERRRVKCRVLRRDEARSQLQTWASQLSWASQLQPAVKPGAWRSVGQGLPHRDAFAPSRTARRLADWAAQLPRCGADVASKVMSLDDLLAGSSDSSGRVAFAVMDHDETESTCGIVCIEQKPLQLVGVACNPDGGRKSLCDDAIDEIEAAIKSSK